MERDQRPGHSVKITRHKRPYQKEIWLHAQIYRIREVPNIRSDSTSLLSVITFSSPGVKYRPVLIQIW